MNAETFINDIPTDTARAAHRGTSFSPERRGEQEREGYAQTLAGDYAELQAKIKGHPEQQAALDSEFARYREGYKKKKLALLYSESRCLSWMITGPSNFPVTRNEKRNAVARRRADDLIEFRKRALAAIEREICPWLRPIMSGDSNAVERLTAEISEAEAKQTQMHAINAAHKAFLKDPASLDATEFSEGVKKIIRDYKPTYSWMPHPVAPYQFTNLSANIRRMKKRLEVISRNQARPVEQAQGSNARFEDCPPENGHGA